MLVTRPKANKQVSGGIMIRAFALFMGLAAVAAAQTGPASVELTWFGQSFFVMDTSTGLKVVMDPQSMGGSSNEPVEGVDVVTVTHEHPDHNAVELALGDPTILRGLDGDDYAEIDQTIQGVHIRTVDSFHDTQQGAQRGKNAIFVFELPGLKVVHLGDLGHPLDAEQISAIGPTDVLLVPVSGGPTIGPELAVETVDQLSAKVVVPMHYATAAMAGGGGGEPPARGGAPAARGGEPPAGGGAPAGRGGFSLGGVEPFLELMDGNAEVVQAGHTITISADDLPAERTVMVMRQE